MIISDLEHVNLVTEETTVLGGGGRKKYKKNKHNNNNNGKKRVKLSVAFASGNADAVAFGGKLNIGLAKSNAQTATFPGFAAASSSSTAFSLSAGGH